MAVDWSLLGPPPDIGGAIRQGMEYGRAVRQRGVQQSAFAALARNPDDPEALAALAATGPEGMQSAWAVQDRARAERQRELRRSVFAPTGEAQPSAFAAPGIGDGIPGNIPASSVGSRGWQSRYARPHWEDNLTHLTPEEETRFQEWARTNNVPISPDYDMRGFWKSGGSTSLNANDGQPHYPDRFKTPLHQSFSADSMFADPATNPPRWNDRDQLVATDNVILFDERQGARQPQPLSSRPGYNLDALRQLWAEDPDSAKQIMSFIQGQDEQSRKALEAKYAAAAPVYLELMRVPQEERKTVLQSAAPYLMQAGFTPEDLAAVQLDDRSLRLYGAVGAGIEHYRTVMGPEKYGEGQTAIDPFTNAPLFRTPKQGTTRVGYDEAGREFTYSTAGDPGFGLGNVPGFTAPTLSTGGPAPSGGGQTRGLRNNNPGNLRASDWTKGQPGYKGTDEAGYAIFENEADGRRAGETLLHNYIQRGYDTPAKIVARWAPVGENTPEQVANYTAHVASRLGIGPDDPVTGDMVPRLFDAQREFENGVYRGPGRTAPATGTGHAYTGGTRPGGTRKPTETRVLDGKTYYKVEGEWYDNAEGK